jgi:hypothetical protein
MMTSFAFILGVVPLIFAHGAGAEMRMTLGTTVFSGMLGVTFFGIFLTPVFFSVIDSLGESTLFRSPVVRASPGSPSGCSRSAPPANWCAGWPPPPRPPRPSPPGPRRPNRGPSRAEPVGGPVEHT